MGPSFNELAAELQKEIGRQKARAEAAEAKVNELEVDLHFNENCNREAYKGGAAAMRERCAKLADAVGVVEARNIRFTFGPDLATAIRALSLEGE